LWSTARGVDDEEHERERAEAHRDCGVPVAAAERADHEREEGRAEHWQHETAAVEDAQ
jgi:hypothetical protein